MIGAALIPQFEGVEEVAKEFAVLERDSLDTLERALDVAGATQVERFRTEQLSGRTGGDMGLNQRTGNLHESMRSVTIVEDRLLVSEIYNRGARYWYYHQHGTATLKKRLRLDEDLSERGVPLYESEIERGLAQLINHH